MHEKKKNANDVGFEPKPVAIAAKKICGGCTSNKKKADRRAIDIAIRNRQLMGSRNHLGTLRPTSDDAYQ